ncbi:MAG: hypothetical protein LBJ76_07050 [Candidatus Accumulibacter sp.]|jgi:hypothetical protein|nr:hypothetical protein [Accumulibacter sp.]
MNRHSITTFASIVCLVAGVSPPADAQEEASGTLGRLFFTPEYRQALDRQRQFKTPDTQEEVPDTPTLTIDGVVVRSGGKRTVWINGQPHDVTQIEASIRMEDPARIKILPDGAPPADARVGDTIIRETGESSDLLKEGTLTRSKPGGT